MKILLIGEYSNVHWTLSEGLRKLGHEVTVVSDGDYWKNYQCDISIKRDGYSFFNSLKYLLQVYLHLPKFKGYDIVQIINPIFFDLKAERIYAIYNYLRKNNKKVFMGAFGMDYYWVNTCRTTDTFKYSDFNFGNKLRDDECAIVEVKDWIGTEKEKLNKYIANDCDGIIAGLYEYYACYKPVFKEKTTFIPYPINIDNIKASNVGFKIGDKLRFFIGIQKVRNVYKGTDVMLRALNRIAEKYPDKCEIIKCESVPYEEYKKLLDSSHVLLDQLYSYTPAMNGLLAMAKGMVLVGGGEPENYEVLHETQLKPIVNVSPNEDDVFVKLEALVLHPESIQRMRDESRLYIERHHNYEKVARQYVEFWNK